MYGNEYKYPGETITVTESLNNPFVFYTQGYYECDWTITDPSPGSGLRWDVMNPALKGFDDPCPTGWKVPEKAMWDAGNNTPGRIFTILENTTMGFQTLELGFLPKAGYRADYNGQPYNEESSTVQSYFLFCDQNQSDSTGWLYGMHNDGTVRNPGWHTYPGISVRCARIE